MTTLRLAKRKYSKDLALLVVFKNGYKYTTGPAQGGGQPGRWPGAMGAGGPTFSMA